MYCVHCGATVDGGVMTACGTCGKSLHQSVSAADVGRVIREASSDALAAIRKVAADPFGGLATSFTMLGEPRARAAGIAFGVGFGIITAIAATIAASGGEAKLKLFFGAFSSALAAFAGIVGISMIARKVLGGTGSTGADLFSAGVALQPIGVLVVLAGLLGISNYQFIGILALIAWSYMMCILFAGCTRLVLIPERFVPPVIAAMLLAAVWLSSITLRAFDSSSPFRVFN